MTIENLTSAAITTAFQEQVVGLLAEPAHHWPRAHHATDAAGLGLAAQLAIPRVCTDRPEEILALRRGLAHA